MKTSKKILSIVLAVMLLVGIVAVAASADTTMVYEKAGSKLVYTATANKAANADGVIELTPGETVTVSVYAQANYYFGTTGSEIFAWTAGFFNTFTEANVTTHNFVNNYTPNKKVIAASSASQLGTGYNKGTHEGYLFGRTYSTDCTTAYDASTATLGYTFTFTVPETATIGATGEFRMPETCSATVATTSRMRQIYAAVNNSGSAYNSGTVASIYPETIDLTGTILNFKVVSAEVPAVPCDYAALDAALVAAANVDTTGNYTAATLTEFQAAYGEAKGIARDLTVDEAGVNQKLIDDAAARLIKAITDLTPLGKCDYAALDAAIAAYEAKAADKALYANWADYEVAYNAAKAVARDMVADEAGANQKVIDDAAAALNAVVLTYKAADYSAVDAAKAAATAIDASKYTAASVKAVNDAVAAVVTGYDITKQAQVDAMAKAINDAIANLVPLSGCNYAALDAAIAAYEAKVADKALYTNWADYEAAYNAAKAVARDMIADEAGANQAKIDNAAAALNAVVLEYKAADYSAVDAAKAAAAQVDASKYTSASVKAVDDAVAAVVTGYNITKQAEVDAMAKAINDAIAKLAPLAPCDYDALDDAISTTPAYSAEYYNSADYAAYTAALAAAKAIARDMLADEAGVNQKAIDDAAAALVNAYNKLVPAFVDLSALEAALELTPEYDAEYYDAADYAAWQDAVAAGRDTYYGVEGEADTEEFRNEVAAAVAAINAAFAKLEPAFIDYSALEQAVAAYGETAEEADAYTEETYEPYAAALARAKDMLANKNTNAPASDAALAAQITAAAGELKSTFEALEIAPLNTIVKNVTAKDAYYKVGDTVKFDFLCSVTGVAKLQVVFANGSTSTYSRTHSAVTIVDNGDGTETWTIALKIYYDYANVTAKAKVGKTWEDKGYKFIMETSDTEDYAVKSVVTLDAEGNAANAFTTGDTFTIKLVCGSDTLRIRLVDQKDGSTSTYTRAAAVQDEDGNWVWTITRKAATGEFAYDIYTTGSTNKLTDEGTDLAYKVTAPVVIEGPSTGDNADVVVTATVAKARLIVGDTQTVTVVTDKNALGVKVTDATGAVHAAVKGVENATVNADGTLTWTLAVSCTRSGTFTFNVGALYGNQWMNNGASVSYRVIY